MTACEPFPVSFGGALIELLVWGVGSILLAVLGAWIGRQLAGANAQRPRANIGAVLGLLIGLCTPTVISSWLAQRARVHGQALIVEQRSQAQLEQRLEDLFVHLQPGGVRVGLREASAIVEQLTQLDTRANAAGWIHERLVTRTIIFAHFYPGEGGTRHADDAGAVDELAGRYRQPIGTYPDAFAPRLQGAAVWMRVGAERFIEGIPQCASESCVDALAFAFDSLCSSGSAECNPWRENARFEQLQRALSAYSESTAVRHLLHQLGPPSPL